MIPSSPVSGRQMPEWKFVVYFSVIGKRKFCEPWLAACHEKGATKTAAPSKTRVRR
ncbi:hypothetical protein MES5069_60145 [Mesorhizobium escarrei]|uniref:Uncharacterized protein n=1 Tax=Mesorhizobium escarrei TaxID=666018 RepID=A0ABM9EFG7_9HYPH|nr:hypothetical protein MES5069_60145 [Mesorhizobium escarrei]